MNNDITSTIGSKIKKYRIAKGYSVNKLSYESGVAQSYLRDLELGNKDNPTVLTLSHICDALDIALKDFFNDNADTEISNDNLSSILYRLNADQKRALCCFLETLLYSDIQSIKAKNKET